MNTQNSILIGKASIAIMALVLFAVVAVAMPQGIVKAEGFEGGDYSLDWGSFSYGDDFGGGGMDFAPDGQDSSGWDFAPDSDYGYDQGDYSDSFGGETYEEWYTESYDSYGDSYGGGYTSGCGYFCGSGGGSYTTPGCTGCGYTPKPNYPVTVGGGSQSQSQSQGNTNTNTNTNINNNTAIAVVQVGAQTATQPSYPTYPTYPAPYCSIYQAQYTSYGANQVYLSWTSSNANSAYLSGYGSVAVNGSQTVYSSYNQTFTLTVYGYNGQQATCQTTVHNYVPTTPYVSLTQIPYTGFDFGPFGNAMYWAGLALLALGGAYLTVYYIPALAFARGSYKRSFAPVVAEKAPILVEREASAAKVAPIVEALRKNGTNDSMAIVHVNGSMPKIVVDRS